MRKLYRTLISHGTQGFDAKTARRLRTTNGIALIVAGLLVFQLATMTVVLSLAGQSPFTFGNLMLLVVAALMLPTAFLHRFSRFAGGAYLLMILVGATVATLAFMGRAMGNEFAFIVLAAVVPVLFGTEYRWINYLLCALMVASFLLAEAYAPYLGPTIDGRAQGVIDLQRNVVIGIIIAIVFLVVSRAFRIADATQDALEAEHARSEALLYNLLPEKIAARLKVAPGTTIADDVNQTAILFADIVGFTPRSSRMKPDELVNFLNRVFSSYDALAEKHGLEKIKTIGDAYMAVAGLPDPVDQPVKRTAEMAFDMLRATREVSDEIGDNVELRVGIHAGPVVAGVIGQRKLFYDVWGETVNTASRMESYGQAGRVQVTAAAKEALGGEYSCVARGPVDIKGIGELETWWLTEK